MRLGYLMFWPLMKLAYKRSFNEAEAHAPRILHVSP